MLKRVRLNTWDSSRCVDLMVVSASRTCANSSTKIIFLHEKCTNPNPAIWSEIVLAMHYVFVKNLEHTLFRNCKPHSTISMEEAKHIVRRYDSTWDGGLKFSEFSRCVKPLHPKCLILDQFNREDRFKLLEGLLRSQTKQLVKNLGHTLFANELDSLLGRLPAPQDS